MSSRLPRLTLRGWFLTSLLSVLAALIVIQATHIYVSLSDLITQGFDRKLLAISTTTAAFIDPADHARLVEPLQLTGIARNTADGTLLAYDRRSSEFLKIRPADGFASVSTLKLPPGFHQLATGTAPDTLIILDAATGELRLFSLRTGEHTPLHRLEPPVVAIASDSARGVLYIGGRHLDRLDLRTGIVTRLAQLHEPTRDLTFDPERQTLWGLGESGSTLLDLNSADGLLRRRIPLAQEKPEGAAETWKPAPVRLVAIVFDEAAKKLLGTERSLLHIDPATGLVSPKKLLSGFGRELGPGYLRYAAPMRRITNRANLTFLYTQLVTERDHIIYGLDGTVGEKHSAILSTDTLPASETAGIQQLLADGTPHLTTVRAWDQWGLLKSAFAPIFDATGHPVAMVGADVDITTIRYATHRALVITFAFGALLLLVAGLLSLAIARQLARPLARIKAAALRAAAGDYAQHVAVAHPRELRELAAGFSNATAGLGRRFVELDAAVADGRAVRDRGALLTRLADVPPLAAAPAPGAVWTWGALDADAPAPGGAIIAGDAALAWCGAAGAEPLIAAAHRAELAVLAHALLTRHGADPVVLAPLLTALAPNEVAAWVLLTSAGVHVLARRPGLVHRLSPGSAPAPLTPAAFTTPIVPAPGEAIIVTSTPAGPTSPAAAAPATLAAWRRAAAGAHTVGYAVIFQPSA